jgi:hypothetical protein
VLAGRVVMAGVGWSRSDGWCWLVAWVALASRVGMAGVAWSGSDG